MKNKWLRRGVRLAASCPTWRAIPVGVGLVLLFAAALKVVSRPVASSLPFNSNWFVIALLSAEVLLAIWLCSGVLPAASRLMAVGLFSAFAIFNWAQITAGAVSCACFGAVGLNPWVALAVDATAVAMLIYWQPLATSFVTRAQIAGTVLVLSLICIMAVSGLRTHNKHQALLEVFPKVLDFGSIPQGTCGQAEFVLRNPRTEPILITHVETSCPCLHIRLSRGTVRPGGELKGVAFLDMSREPQFWGKLTIEAKGATTDQKNPAFVVLADVSVE